MYVVLDSSRESHEVDVRVRNVALLVRVVSPGDDRAIGLETQTSVTLEDIAATGSEGFGLRVYRPEGADVATHAAATFRFAVHPGLRHSTVGLRLACGLR